MTRMKQWAAGLLVVGLAWSVQAGVDEGAVAYGRGDYAAAAKEFRAAAEQGDAYAQFNLGILYAQGQGVTKSDEEAVAWYRKAAEQGFAPAQYQLGEAYEEIVGVWRDYTLAVEWYRKAAEQGYGKAQFSLGLMYARGLGVQADVVEAHKWFHLAERSGEPYAERNRRNAEKKMSAEQIARALELAQQWAPRAKTL